MLVGQGAAHMLLPLLLPLLAAAPALAGGYGAPPPTRAPYQPGNEDHDVSAEGKAVNDQGMDATSKACRYDDGPGWSDCDPFELIRFRVLRLIHGGSQCEEVKNITKHCTPHDFPFGTHWLIQEHRKCIAELNRLKSMIADLHKFIEVLHQKGKELFAAYVKLKGKLDELNQTLDKLKTEGEHQQQVLTKLKEDIEEWKTKARELQVQLDEMKTKYHDLQTEDHELTLRNEQMQNEVVVITKENEVIIKKIEKLARDNEELRRRIIEAEHNREKAIEKKGERNKLQARLESLTDTLQGAKDELAECRINNLAKSVATDNSGAVENKDTHVDLTMEMYITHNKTTLYKPTYKPIYFTTEKNIYKKEEESPKCLISYYGVTNETCWYESEGEKSEDSYVDALGHHLVEAHWKYFTIDVKDQYECDKATFLHYEFLLKRCSPKHYLPVLSIFRPSASAAECGTHIYPKLTATGGRNTCWITFLGAHGHCEAHSNKYDLYNTDDNSEGYSQGVGTSKEKCLARAAWWMKYCDTPVIVTYVPEGVSTNWEEDWIMHDSHGGRMFEATQTAKNNINPDSLKPPKTVSNSGYKSEFKSMEPKSPDYHDSPEYRKSLHLQGREKEELLQKLRARLGLSARVSGVSKDVKQHAGVDTSITDIASPSIPEESMEIAAPAAESADSGSYAPPASPYAPPSAAPYVTPPPASSYAPPPPASEVPPPPEQPKYEEPPPKYEEPPPKYVEPPPKYVEPPPKYVEPPPKYVEPPPPAPPPAAPKY